jgi:hypothetical protein
MERKEQKEQEKRGRVGKKRIQEKAKRMKGKLKRDYGSEVGISQSFKN